MNFKPILFSSEMVRAILDNRKTQTRRIVKLKHLHMPDVGAIHPDGSGKGWIAWAPGKGVTAEFTRQAYPGNHGFKCPYGQVGDVLWVREEHYRYGKWVKNGETATGRQKWKFVPDAQFTEVRYFDNPPAVIEKNSHRSTGWYKRLARFMSKSPCRIFLQITDIRVERVQDISEVDAIAEGVQKNCAGIIRDCPACRDSGVCQAANEWFHYTHGLDDFPAYSAIESFHSLWEKINGRESLEANPWVWAIT